MLKVAYEIIKDFGTVGFVVLFGASNFYLVWKLGSNHLHTLQESIDKLFEKTETIEKSVNEQSNRISTIEGKLE